jgi:hypothetical protein
MMECVLEMHECLNKNYGITWPADACGDPIVNSGVCLESAGGTVTELAFFRTHLTTLPVQKAAIR